MKQVALKIKQGDFVYYKDGQLATVDFVFKYDEDTPYAIDGLALTLLDTGDELMCGADEVTLVTNEVTELLYEQGNKVSEEPLDKT